jgi:hypothetical protein
LNREVLELGTGFQFLSQPNRLRATPCPGVAFVVAVFDGDLATFE